MEHGKTKDTRQIQDPVCGMVIKDIDKAPASHYEGKKYYFCSDLCRIQFDQQPENYIKKDEEPGHSHHH
ncbi:hypothetical protein MROS_0795 [Melioribacter roseus P3M-2]|uniref:TRASH domain-containing protein n=1 Tax=Melioribacter roseus (strain DSM 23840 / JCM 17771 / VKM B-2668 / P3M-2) TaxID=1191523 RepID=I7A289_MELRP|nr:YHS domain-containing protein [Melioribacter roseus]AFN74036.1 hypothetical protein MROS_0795 [Melioribacter roseus P3M-2]